MPPRHGILFPVQLAASAVLEARINGVLYQCVVIILCCLRAGGAAVITLWTCGKSCKTITLHLRNGIIMGYNEALYTTNHYDMPCDEKPLQVTPSTENVSP